MMIWPSLATIFVLSSLLLFFLALALTLKTKFCRRHRAKILIFYIFWFVPYMIFISFYTGPSDLEVYPAQSLSPHEDGQRSGYFHLSKGHVQVHFGDTINQGQLIALSGMVGQTWFPHLHFVVFNKGKTASLPISFADVPGGIPFAGHFYTSENGIQ